MGIMPFIKIVVGHAVALMIDIIVLLVVIRLICRWRQVSFLRVFDTAGRPLVDGLTQKIAELWMRSDRSRPLSERQTLALALAFLLGARLLFSAIWSALL